MTSAKYIGMDVHKEAILIAVMNSTGKLLMESIIETRQTPFCSSLPACEEICTSLSKKGPGRRGYTICFKRM